MVRTGAITADQGRAAMAEPIVPEEARRGRDLFRALFHRGGAAPAHPAIRRDGGLSGRAVGADLPRPGASGLCRQGAMRDGSSPIPAAWLARRRRPSRPPIRAAAQGACRRAGAGGGGAVEAGGGAGDQARRRRDRRRRRGRGLAARASSPGAPDLATSMSATAAHPSRVKRGLSVGRLLTRSSRRCRLGDARRGLRRL